ncbi:type VI secretion system tip protein TssI/VgrG [Caballeronia sp. LZ034LL]|uniref:type VI secretion system Vgr family protein n=1 Tax=Caballeronia sp. LZ034LL TaxID=3038567 RepID=UPI002858B22E|nr:type VI secretion system tip protein TssI/VgrG [Caballeronia sp. LZ034LL]MDR5837107.1 type VI secretion system tip protein TssI/VgrG [Caballeronia sp. LZ034LL]
MTSLSARLANNQRFGFASDAYAADTFSVVRMSGREAISQLYRFELTLVSDDADIDLAKMLQNNATLTIGAPDNASRTTPYSGMLAEFDQLHHAGGYTFYRAVLVPRAWRLTLTRTCEVYLNEQTIPQIVGSVLRDAQLTGNAVDLKLTGTYRPRSYVCQFQESHFDFVSRWLEKEGIYYYFAQSGQADTLTLVDDRAMHAADALPLNYRPSDELDTGVAPDSVQRFVCRVKPLPAKVVLQDYNYRRASVPLVVQAAVSPQGAGEAMFYSDNFRDADEGTRYATLRAQEILCGGERFDGESTAVGLRSGYFVQLAHHYRDDFNGRYLVTEITHEGSQAGALLAGIRTPFSENGEAREEIIYRNTFSAIRAGVQFRAPRVTPRPTISGTLSASVDAEGSGDYAELDAYGQYTVQLPFDRTDKAAAKGSARIRMATPYSGDGHGMHFPLLKGTEVLLAFDGGDPDQPVIVGTVPNSVNSSVVNQANPAMNRMVTKGGNIVEMSDKDGSQTIHLFSPGGNTHVFIGN